MVDISHTHSELWFTRCGVATATALAEGKGWLQAEFENTDINLRALRGIDDTTFRDAHYTHELNGLIREGGNVPPIWTRAAGRDIAVIGITWVDEYQGVLTRADSSLRSLEDLKGKRVGFPVNAQAVIDFQHATAQHGFYTALKLAGLSLDDVEVVELAQQQTIHQREIAALESGEVDAVFVRFAQGYQWSQDARFRELLNINTLPDHIQRVNNGTPRLITVDRDFLDQRPDVVVRYLAVLLETAEWAAQNQDAVLELLQQDNAHLNRESILAAHGGDVHTWFEPKLIFEYVAGLEAQKNFLLAQGWLANDFDVRSWVESWPLARAHKLVAERRAAVRVTAAA